MEEFSMSENAKDLIQQEIDRNPFLVLSKLVYQQIYREIINGNLLPQHRIVESKIAKELNVSRSPVKMALAEMTEKGILEKVKGNRQELRLDLNASLKKKNIRLWLLILDNLED